MKGIITSYRRGRGTQKPNQMVVMPEKNDNSTALIGKKVVYKTKTKEIVGEVRSLHGNKGAIRVRFETGMPGQSIFKEVSISE